ncbi:MAG TPA: hypothetical protein VK608_14660 [Edaphobacter sp.]|nr:hypothetical protein [Edaphobacter sp.]
MAQQTQPNPANQPKQGSKPGQTNPMQTKPGQQQGGTTNPSNQPSQPSKNK